MLLVILDNKGSDILKILSVSGCIYEIAIASDLPRSHSTNKKGSRKPDISEQLRLNMCVDTHSLHSDGEAGF